MVTRALPSDPRFDPARSLIDPLAPVTELPDCNRTAPELDSDEEVSRLILPPTALPLAPDTKFTEPPVEVALAPAAIKILALCESAESPTEREMPPDLPKLSPLVNATEPEVPD